MFHVFIFLVAGLFLFVLACCMRAGTDADQKMEEIFKNKKHKDTNSSAL